VFVRDLESRTTTRLSLTATGGQANARSFGAHISADGSVVAFVSAASLVSGRDPLCPFGCVRAYVLDRTTGTLGTSDEEQARFEEFANEAACPALDPATGLCDVYEWRPMTCRVFGPPVRMAEGDQLGCCELCFLGASEEEIAGCEMPVPIDLEERLVGETGDKTETIVAYVLSKERL